MVEDHIKSPTLRKALESAIRDKELTGEHLIKAGEVTEDSIMQLLDVPLPHARLFENKISKFIETSKIQKIETKKKKGL